MKITLLFTLFGFAVLLGQQGFYELRVFLRLCKEEWSHLLNHDTSVFPDHVPCPSTELSCEMRVLELL